MALMKVLDKIGLLNKLTHQITCEAFAWVQVPVHVHFANNKLVNK